MTRTMHDSTNPSAIPADAEMVALYVDGRYAASAADWDRFPNAVKVRISAIGVNTNAHVFDVEPGCIWPPTNVVPLVLAARRLGIDPTVYCNEHNDWAPTRQAFDSAGVAHPHWWVANYDNRKTIPDGAVAKQYADPGMDGVGGHYDLSVVADYWPGVDGSFDNPSKTNPEGGFMANLTEAEQREVLAAARKLTTLFNPLDDDRPLSIGTPDDIPGHVLSVRGLQEKMRNAQALDRKSIANIETIVNRIDARGASGGMTAEDRSAFVTDLAAALPESVSVQTVVNALRQLNWKISVQQVPSGG